MFLSSGTSFCLHLWRGRPTLGGVEERRIVLKAFVGLVVKVGIPRRLRPTALPVS